VGALAGAGGIISLGTNTLITNSSANTTLASQITGTGGLTKQGGGILTLAGSNTYSGATTVSGGLINFSSLGNFGTGTIILNGGGVQWAAGNTLDISSSPRLVLGPAGATFDTNGNNVSFATPLGGTAAITKAGNGILTFATNNNYSGGTTVTGGLINFASAGSFGSGLITLNGGGLQWAAGSTADISSKLAPLGAGGGVFDTNGNTVTFATGLTGTGGLAKQGLGTLNLTGNNTYTGGTAVLAGTLAVNGSIAGNVAVGPAGTLGGNGTIAGSVVNTGTLAPGNSIGLLTVNGSYTQTAGSTYQVEVNNAGQGDRINVGGAAAIQGGTVQVLAAAGSYGNSTTYTILRANGGVAGTYSAVSSNFAFLTPTLSYDANDVFLTLALGQNAFISFSGITPNQKAVGTALNQSFANAAGDFATVIGVLAGLNTQQGPAALDAISGQPYADFGTMNTNNAALFMNALGQQMANARGSSASPGQRQAMAQACEIESCDGTGPLSAWASALGGLGSVLGDGNASTLTYNFGGAAAGMDYRFDPRFLAGIGVGYTHGTQWVNSFMGQGWSDSVSVAAYGSFTQSGFYVDALAGYAYYGNQLQRQILIPGLQQRTATGSTGANQFLGQIEGGYKLGIYAPAAATITPFGRFQISSVTQNAFNESGAQSLNLNVAQQTTNSQRTTIGADLGSSIGFGEDKKVDFAVRLGWLHEFANVARPITAAFAGAPGNSFTVFGATPLRNSAVVGLQATTHIAAATQIYLRYDGEIASGTDNHALNIGVRMSW
jgi:outer membrane autotransporter protein